MFNANRIAKPATANAARRAGARNAARIPRRRFAPSADRRKRSDAIGGWRGEGVKKLAKLLAILIDRVTLWGYNWRVKLAAILDSLRRAYDAAFRLLAGAFTAEMRSTARMGLVAIRTSATRLLGCWECAAEFLSGRY